MRARRPPCLLAAVQRCYANLAGNFTEAQQGEIRFPEISGHILEKVISPTPLTEAPVRLSSAPKLSLSPPLAPTLGPRSRHRPCCRPCPSPCLRPETSHLLLASVWQTVQYFYYKLRYTNHQGTLPEFKIEPENALELLMAANYLDT